MQSKYMTVKRQRIREGQRRDNTDHKVTNWLGRHVFSKTKSRGMNTTKR